jgi:transcriptional regulator of acetoin/glycerol metabolism
VRELKNALERAVVLCRGAELTAADFHFGVEKEEQEMKGLPLSEVEKKHIGRVLRDMGWNISRSARVLGIDRATLYSKIKRYELKKG